MNCVASERNSGQSSGWVVLLGLVLGSIPIDSLEARDRGNPWATPEQRAPAHGLRPYSDGRFAPPDYDPVEQRRRRSPGMGEFFEPGYSDPSRFPGAGERRVVPEVRSWGMPDLHGYGTSPWLSGIYGIPGLTYPGVDPYSSYLGSGMLFPGTGLTTPGLLSPLYGSSTGGIPIFGIPY